jgi:PDZ domain-containing protein
MRLLISVLTGAAALGLVPALEAQKAPKKDDAPKKVLAPDHDGCVTREGRTECVFRKMDFDSALRKRPAIGVQLSATGTMRDTLGVFVSRVVPKGPAEKAGIIEGDRIVSINGVDLRVNAADAEDSYAANLPTRRLTREVGKLNPGGVANLRVWSGGRVRDVQVTVGNAWDLRESGSFGMLHDGIPGMRQLMPGFDGMRMELRDLPRYKLEQMRFPRIRINDGNFRRFNLDRLEDGDLRIFGPEGGVIFERKLKAEAEKQEKEKTKKKK